MKYLDLLCAWASSITTNWWTWILVIRPGRLK